MFENSLLYQAHKGLFEGFFPQCILVGFEKWLNKFLMIFFFPDTFMCFFFYPVWVAQLGGGGGGGSIGMS